MKDTSQKDQTQDIKLNGQVGTTALGPAQAFSGLFSHQAGHSPTRLSPGQRCGPVYRWEPSLILKDKSLHREHQPTTSAQQQGALTKGSRQTDCPTDGRALEPSVVLSQHTSLEDSG